MMIEMLDEKQEYLTGLGRRARAAETALRTLGEDDRNRGLRECAGALVAAADEILEANEKDVQAAEKGGMKASLVDRLRLTKERIEAMAEGLRQVAELPDPLGRVLDGFDRPNGLSIEKISVPIGVIGIIYESRPNVTADAFALTFKSGNAVILKGGSDALASNGAIVKVIRQALEKADLPADSIIFIDTPDREVAAAFMRLHRYVDVLIPRGGAGLIRAAVENATIPVIETGTGNCHVYVDKEADVDMAVKIIHNAKTQRMGVCNACESLLIHSDIADEAIPAICADLSGAGIEMRCDDRSLKVPGAEAAAAGEGKLREATQIDWGTEYGDAVISIKLVDSLEEAIEHINHYGTHHSDAIVTKDEAAAQRFLAGIDSAAVYWNASTRFTDGFEFGFGAEIGISTQKLHARGPMGLKELTSYKYQIKGSGQVRG